MPCERKHIEAIMKALTDKGLMIMSIDATADAFKAALAACDESPWRSMESAPKDGTWVEVGRHINGEWEYCKSGYFYDPGNAMEGEPSYHFWAEDYDTCGVTDDGGMWLTHWRPCDVGPAMPLPAAPEGEKP